METKGKKLGKGRTIRRKVRVEGNMKHAIGEELARSSVKAFRPETCWILGSIGER